MAEKIIEKSANVYQVQRRNGHGSWTDLFVSKNKEQLSEQLVHEHIHNDTPVRIASAKFRIQHDSDYDRPEFVSTVRGEEFVVRAGDPGYNHLASMFTKSFNDMIREDD